MLLGSLAWEELLWWMENLKLCNGRKIQQREPIPCDHSGRCHNKMLGGILQGSFDREEMVKGEAFSHKCSRITGIKICSPNFHKEFVTPDHSRSSRQSWSGISFEDGWYPQSTASKKQVNLELSAISSDHNYCRVPSEQVECQSRQIVQECNRLFRLETSSENLSENNQTLRNPKSWFVCLQAMLPTFSIYGREARFSFFNR